MGEVWAVMFVVFSCYPEPQKAIAYEWVWEVQRVECSSRSSSRAGGVKKEVSTQAAI